MAGSRLERVGTVFTRVRDLMRSGVMKPEDKPIWYDVYKAFPPKRDPTYVKPYSRLCTNVQDTVPEIFYEEDEVRARFYKEYGTGYRHLDLARPNFVSTCEKFINKYAELKRDSKLDESALFVETGMALLAESIILRRKAPPASTRSKHTGLDLKLKDMLAEQQGLQEQQEQGLQEQQEQALQEQQGLQEQQEHGLQEQQQEQQSVSGDTENTPHTS